MTTDPPVLPDAARPRPRNRGVYLLPNLFTTAVLFSGFYAIVVATDGNFDRAGIAIFIAMVCDGLDGRIARWTNTQTESGKEYDSLSDMVAFGLASRRGRVPVGRGPHRGVRLRLGPWLTVPALLEVNLSGELSKSGVPPEEIAGFVERYPLIRGLMTMPPLADDPEASRPYFRRLSELATEHGLRELSMGTSQDYRVAVEEGATYVRIGTVLFAAVAGRDPERG